MNDVLVNEAETTSKTVARVATRRRPTSGIDFDLAAGEPSAPATAPRGWTIALWFAQVVLAGMFGFAGVLKLTTPIADLAAIMPWVADMPALVRFIGLSEVAGAIGLILPSLLRIGPKLTTYAAIGLAIIMVLAVGFHAVRGEFNEIGMNVLLGALAMFVAWGRTRKAPIAPRVSAVAYASTGHR